MMAAWIGYCLVISALFALAAWAGERALAHYRKPVRWVWAGAIGGSLVVPLAAFLFPPLTSDPVLVAPLAISFETPAAVAIGGSAGAPGGATPPAWLESAGTLLFGLWIGSVAGLGLFLSNSYRRLRREMRSWTPGQVLDSPVLLSPDRGPAVVGVRRAVIVLPRWVVQLEEDLLRMIFLHEREHQRVGDHKLFAFGLAGVVLMPWNPVLWWSLRRLRLGMEFDCDRRVLARGVPEREYAEALLTVGGRIAKTPLVATTFAEPRSAVETRLRRMTQPLGRLRGPRSLAAASMAGLALVLACQSEPPVSPLAESAEPDVVEVPDAGPLAPGSAQPTFIPYDAPPRLENSRQVLRALQDEYPRDLRDAGIGGRVELWLYVSGTGDVENAQVKTSSGHPRIDAAALKVADGLRFVPARHQDEVTPVWVSQWFTFEVPSGEAAVDPREPSEADSGGHVVVRGEGMRTVAGKGSDLTITGDRIEIQGLGGSFTPSQEAPLIVIDGVIQGPSVRLGDLNQLEIDRLEIVRGEAAVELYGRRGSNGVIQITTKAAAARAPSPDEVPEGEAPIAQIETDPAERVIGISDAAGSVRIREGDDELRPRPLLVIDGVIAAPDVELSDLQADDIAHVEIVKGAAAVPRYGERARQGVIRVTTKQTSGF